MTAISPVCQASPAYNPNPNLIPNPTNGAFGRKLPPLFQCSVTCGDGIRRRRVTCRDVTGDDVTADGECAGVPLLKPSTTKRCRRRTECHVQHHWLLTAWSPVRHLLLVVYCVTRFKVILFYRVAQKIWHNFLYAFTSSNIRPIYENYFTVSIRRKFVIILALKIPPRLKCVAALPCEMSSVLKANGKHDDFCNNAF